MLKAELEEVLKGKEVTLAQGRKILVAEFGVEADEDDPLLIPWCLGLIAVQAMYPKIVDGAQMASDRIVDEAYKKLILKVAEYTRAIEGLIPGVDRAANALNTVERATRTLNDVNYDIGQHAAALKAIMGNLDRLQSNGFLISPGVLYGLGAVIALAAFTLGVLFGSGFLPR